MRESLSELGEELGRRLGLVGRPRLGLLAEVESLSLSALLRDLHAGRRTGLLHFRYRDHRKCLWLERGEVVFGTSSLPADRLGECLVRAGVIPLSELREAERHFAGTLPGERFGKVLVERGLLTPRDLWNGVKGQVEEIVRSLFAYPGGQVSFWEGVDPPDNIVRLALPTAQLVEEGLQRSEELRRFLEVLRDPRVLLARAPVLRAELVGHERAIALEVGAGRRFEEVREALGLDPLSAARSVQLLRLVGAVKLVRGPSSDRAEAEAQAAAHEAEELRRGVGAAGKRIAQLVEALASAEGSRHGIDGRLARVLDEAAGRFPAVLAGIALHPGGRLDIEALARRAVRLPEDRREDLLGVLGELVAYLEFEVRSHPGIADPSGLLAGARVAP